MFISGDFEPMLKFDRSKVDDYNRFDNALTCVALTTTGVVIFNAALNAGPLGRVCIPVFCCDVLALLSWSWNIFYQSHKIRYGYEKRHDYYVACLLLRWVLLAFLSYSSYLHGIEFVTRWLQLQPPQSSLFILVVSMLGSAVFYVFAHAATLLYYRNADHWSWRIYVNELDMNDKPMSFPEYCQSFTK